jgi:DNA invertase Pin-like site-specific DNA recombinase
MYENPQKGLLKKTTKNIMIEEMKIRKAYSYQRFSSLKQSHGDSLRRQEQAALSFCKQFKLLLSETFTDEGTSAFKGKNWSHGSALNAFVKLVDNGTIQKGSVLVVESMDRLDRRQIVECLESFLGLLRRGVSIGCVSQNRIFDTKSINENSMELMQILVEYSRAGNENLMKSNRAKGIINSRIERAKNGEKVYFGVNGPTWVIGVKDGKFIMNYEKVKLVQEIFTRYLAGHAATRIANELNTDKVPTLKRKGAMWNMSTVLTLLRNQNVIGWCKVDQRNQNEHGETVTENSFEKDDYYPQIISDNVFQLTQRKLEFNSKDCGGSKYGLVRNLFKGLLICPECNESIETKINTYISELTLHPCTALRLDTLGHRSASMTGLAGGALHR